MDGLVPYHVNSLVFKLLAERKLHRLLALPLNLLLQMLWLLNVLDMPNHSIRKRSVRSARLTGVGTDCC